MKELIALLFLARDIAHREHLKTRSFAAHMALNEFYTGIIENADAIAEAYQGQYGKLLSIPYMKNPSKASIESIFRNHLDWIEKNRYNDVPVTQTAIQNLVDEAVSTYQTALYKLKFLS